MPFHFAVLDPLDYHKKFMPNRIAIGFVIYDPTTTQLKRIKDACDLGFFVYVYDNTPDNNNSVTFADNRQNIVYLTCGKNAGLGLGITSICAQAYYDKHTALIFFDQDTRFNFETLSFIEDYYNNNCDLKNNYSAILFKATNHLHKKNDDGDNFRDVQLAINSGSLFFLGNLKKLNWHNPNFFVDCVDYDFCLNSQIHGFKIGEFSATPGFDHSTEQDDAEYSVFGRKYLMRAYSRRRILDTTFASFKILYKSLKAARFVFFSQILKLFVTYMITQIFVRTVGSMFKVENSV